MQLRGETVRPGGGGGGENQDGLAVNKWSGIMQTRGVCVCVCVGGGGGGSG